MKARFASWAGDLVSRAFIDTPISACAISESTGRLIAATFREDRAPDLGKADRQ